MDQHKWKSGRVDDVIMLVIDVGVADHVNNSRLPVVYCGAHARLFCAMGMAQDATFTSRIFGKSAKGTPLLASQTAGL